MKNSSVRVGVAIFVIIGFVFLASSCQREDGDSSAAGTGEWRFAIEEIQGSVQDAYARKFKELIEKQANGAIKVTVYPYGSLGTSDQITELVHMGALQFAMASPGHLGKIIPELQLLLLHFIFSENNQVNKAVLGSGRVLKESFDKLYQQKGLKLLSLYPEGWQVWTTKKPIKKPADFAGLKMRVMTSPILIEAYKAYGASPTPLPYSEVYSALQLNMIEGQVNPVFAVEEMSFYEVTDYMTLARHAPFVTSLVTNPRFFHTLSAEKRRMVEEAVAQVNEYIFTVQEKFNSERLEKIKKRRPDLKIIQLSAQEREIFRKASLPVRQKYVAMVGAAGEEILNRLLKEIAKAEGAWQAGNVAGNPR